MIAARERAARRAALDEAAAAINIALAEATGERRIGLGQARKMLGRLKHPSRPCRKRERSILNYF
jgi:hypothetical protein